MKELTQQDKIESKDLQANVQQLKTKKHLGSFVKTDGLKIWEFNYTTLTMREARYSESAVFITGTSNSLEKQSKKTVNTQENCQYIQALNELNAWKKAGYKFDRIVNIYEGLHFIDTAIPGHPAFKILKIDEKENRIIIAEQGNERNKQDKKLGEFKILFNLKRYKKCAI